MAVIGRASWRIRWLNPYGPAGPGTAEPMSEFGERTRGLPYAEQGLGATMQADPSRRTVLAADPSSGARTDTSAFAWIAVAFGVAIVGGLVLALWAIVNGEAPDVAASPYHVPFYLGLAALVGYSLARVVRATVEELAGTPSPTPTGFLASRAATAIWPSSSTSSWREGVGIYFGIEEGYAEPGGAGRRRRHDRYLLRAAILLGPRARARPACRHRSRSPPSAGRAASP